MTDTAPATAKHQDSLNENASEASKPQISDIDNEEEICRICRCGSEEGKPLFHPCICTGSIRYVHEECLLEWLTHSQNSSSNKCELCGHSFGFTPVYAPNSPLSLSMWEFFKLCSLRGLKLIPLGIRFFLVAITWGIFIPIITCAMFRILSLGKLDRNAAYQAAYENAPSGWASFFVRLRMALEGGYYSSWGIGVCVCACIVLSFLTLISVVDFVREHDLVNPDEEENAENAQEEVPIQIANAGNIGQGPIPVPLAPNHGFRDGVLNLDGNQNAALQNNENREPLLGNDQPGNPRPQQGWEEEDGADENNGNYEEEGEDDDEVDEQNAADEDVGDDGVAVIEDQGDAGNGFLDGVDAFIEGEDAENNVGDLNVAMDELLGLRGPGWVLFHNVLWLLTFNGLYLCVALFAPTTAGAIIISLVTKGVEFITGRSLLSTDDISFLLRTQIKPKDQAKELGLNNIFMFWNSDLKNYSVAPVCLSREKDEIIKGEFFSELHWGILEFSAVVIGYISFALGLSSLFYAAKFMRDSALDSSTRNSWKRITRILSLVSRTLKVVIIVFLKMGVFPVMLGLLLEYAGRDIVNLGPINRYEFATSHPVFAIIVLWVAGITHMLVITVIVLELRDVLHPDILHGIIRPKDADESLLRTVLEDSVSKHVRRMVLSCAIYTFLVFAFIFIPAKAIIASGYGPFILPYAPVLKYTVLEIQLPVELLCIHIGVLNMLDQGKGQIKFAIETWFRIACGILGLTSFLLPVNIDEASGNQPQQDNLLRGRVEEQANDRREPQQQTSRLKPRSKPSYWLFRVVILLLVAWMMSLIFTWVSLAIPLYLGRYVVSLLQIPITHEPIVYGLGCIIIWRITVGILVLKLYRFPPAFIELFGKVFKLDSTSQYKALKITAQWIVSVVFGIFISPWLLGIIAQLEVLMPSAHPALVENGIDSSLDLGFIPGWSFPTQLHALLVAISGHLRQLNSSDIISLRSLESNQTEQASNIANSLRVSSGPMHDWLVGLVIQMVLLQLLFVHDFVQQREILRFMHQRVVAAMDEVVRNYDCSVMLHNVILPICAAEVGFLIIPFITTGPFDACFFLSSGLSVFKTHGVIYVFRISSISLLLTISAPILFSEIFRTLNLLHDTLRDEEYLVGKRLHNFDPAPRSLSQSRTTLI